MSASAKISLQEWWHHSPLRFSAACLYLGSLSFLLFVQFLHQSPSIHQFVVGAVIAVFGFALSSLFNLVVHELGHAFVAKWLGCRVFAVEIGVGRILAQFHLSGLPILLRINPSSAIVRWVSLTFDHCRRNQALVTLGGMLSTLAVLLGLGVIVLGALPHWETQPVPHFPEALFSGLIGATLVMFCGSWIPFKFKHGNRVLSTDIIKLSTLPWTPDAALHEPIRVTQILMDIESRKDLKITSIEEALANVAQKPNDVSALFNAWHHYALKTDSRALIYSRATLAMTPPESPSRKLMIDILIGTCQIHGELASEHHARALVEEAYQLAPNEYGNIASYGAALVDLGEFEEGRKILEDISHKSKFPINLGFIHTFLALTEKKAGNITSARSHAALAKRHFPQSQYLRRISDLLEPVNEQTISTTLFGDNHTAK